MSNSLKPPQRQGQKQALGQGLAALLGPDVGTIASAPNTPMHPHQTHGVADATEEDTHTMNPNQTQMLAVDTIIPGKFQPRQHFDQKELEALAQSIREHGVLQPILVRPGFERAYELIAGERRWRAAKLAGLSVVPAIIKTDIDDRQALEIGILENIQRNDLTVMEEARGYQRLMEEFDYTQEMLSQTLGKSRSHVANMVRLLGLEPTAHAYLDTQKISFGHARALVGLYGEQLDYVLDAIVQKNLTVRQTERLVRKVNTYGVHNEREMRNPEIAEKRNRPLTGITEIDDYDEDEESMRAFQSMSRYMEKMIGGSIKIIPKGEAFLVKMNFESLTGVDRLLAALDRGVNGFPDIDE